MRSRYFRQVSLTCVVAMAMVVFATRLGAITPFETDVSTAIDRGIEWLANNGAYSNPSSAGDAAGLPMEALLEKRASGNPADPPQGYTGANATDKTRLRSAASNILDQVNETSFYAYRDGAFMFALASYALSGGPDKSVLQPGNVDYQTIKEAMDALVDRTLANQRKAPTFPAAADQGYWCYTANNCEDSSTTQFAAAGLASAKTFYSSGVIGDQPFADAGRVTSINTALGLTRQAYELNAGQNSDNPACGMLTASERGHGYRTGYNPSLQQTASGVYIQLFGGSNVNTAMVQHYIEWLRNRYRWEDLDSLGNSWPGLSWSYYMWSSFKGMELIRQSGILPALGNLGPNDLGTLPPASAPGCVVRQEHKTSAAVARPVSFGVSPVGFYAGEPQTQYFDYAHEILTHQCYDGSAPINGNDGLFNCDSTPGFWETYSHQSYLLLVLQRATGGGCVDSDGDGVCDADEPKDQIDLNISTSPGVVKAGQLVSVTGGGWPTGVVVAPDVTLYYSTAGCKSPNPSSTTALALTSISGQTKRAAMRVPVGTAPGTYFVWLKGLTAGGFASMNCSKLVVAP